MKAHVRSGFGLFLAVFAASGPAAAQSAGPPAAPPSDVSRSPGSLSDKLGATGGVIHPDNSLDPAMQKTPSVQGNMPVIPPPGTSGGTSDVVPK